MFSEIPSAARDPYLRRKFLGNEVFVAQALLPVTARARKQGVALKYVGFSRFARDYAPLNASFGSTCVAFLAGR
jgi:hypothetical protein